MYSRFCHLQLLATFCLLSAVSFSLLAAERDLRPLSISLEVSVGGRELQMDREFYRINSEDSISVSRLSFLASRFSMRHEDGAWEDLGDQFAHFDLGEGKSEALLSGIPKGRYQALRMTIGLEELIDLQDPTQWAAEHPLNPVANGLHWGMADSGYVYFAIEGRHRANLGQTLGISYHLATQRALTVIELPVSFNVGELQSQLTLHMDLAQLFSAEHGIDILQDGTSTHSAEDDPLAEKLIPNLSHVFTQATALTLTSANGEDTEAPQASFAAMTATSRRVAVTPMFPRFRPSSDNPLTEEGIALGERLFKEIRLSGDNSVSCASCHDQSLAFTDGEPVSIGVSGAKGHRNSMPLFNLAWKTSFFWDGRSGKLRDQIFGPWESPIEMGGDPVADTAEIASDPEYPPLFEAAFADGRVTPENVSLALEQFLFSIVSQESRFDHIYRGRERFSEEEQRGYTLFHTEYDPRLGKLGADCFHCHGGLLLSNNRFHNNGLPLSEVGDRGRADITGNPADTGKFITPSLRNITLTAPYMHDGRFSTLREVIDHYNSGVVRSDTLDPNLAKHPVTGLELSEEDIQALIAFLNTLEDPKFESNDNTTYNE